MRGALYEREGPARRQPPRRTLYARRVAADGSASRQGAEGADSDALREARRQTEVERVRAEHLEAQIGLLENRLMATERSGADATAHLAARESELKRFRSDSELVIQKVTAPLRTAERGLRWIFKKLDRVVGLLGRRVVFRIRSRD